MSAIRRRATYAIVALALVSFTGCSSTPKTSVTRLYRAEMTPAPRSIVVFGVGMDDSNRHLVEDAMVTELRKRGTPATPSYDLFPGALPDRAAAHDAVKKAGIEGALVARLERVQEESTYVPGQQVQTTNPSAPGMGLWSGYYGGPNWGHYEPGYVQTDKIVHFETTFWNANGEGRLLWKATTETANPSAGKDFAKSLTDAVISSLEKDGLVPITRE